MLPTRDPTNKVRMAFKRKGAEEFTFGSRNKIQRKAQNMQQRKESRMEKRQVSELVKLAMDRSKPALFESIQTLPDRFRQATHLEEAALKAENKGRQEQGSSPSPP